MRAGGWHNFDHYFWQNTLLQILSDCMDMAAIAWI